MLRPVPLYIPHRALGVLSKMALDESKNLFLVLGTGSFAKPPLPPSRMLLPEGITEHRGEAN